jgi:hypothetical protein
MPGCVVQLPDGSRAELAGPTAFGRGTPTALSDGFLSRQHMLLTPYLAEGSDAVMLTNQGQNGEHMCTSEWEYKPGFFLGGVALHGPTVP